MNKSKARRIRKSCAKLERQMEHYRHEGERLRKRELADYISTLQPKLRWVDHTLPVLDPCDRGNGEQT